MSQNGAKYCSESVSDETAAITSETRRAAAKPDGPTPRRRAPVSLRKTVPM